MADKFADDIFKLIFLCENFHISIQISLTPVSKDQINDEPGLVEIMAWHRIGDKPLSEPVIDYITNANTRLSASVC